VNKKYLPLQPLFEAYEKASFKATDCFIDSIEARRLFKTAIANYLENEMYLKLKKKSYELFCKFSDALDRL